MQIVCRFKYCCSAAGGKSKLNGDGEIVRNRSRSPRDRTHREIREAHGPVDNHMTSLSSTHGSKKSQRRKVINVNWAWTDDYISMLRLKSPMFTTMYFRLHGHYVSGRLSC